MGVSTDSLYNWRKRYNAPAKAAAQDTQSSEIGRLKQELARITEERDILKSYRVLRQGCKMKYAFIKAHRMHFNVRAKYRMLCIHPSGFYARLKRPFSSRTNEDIRQTILIKNAWYDSGKVYGYRKLHDDLRDQGETCYPNRAATKANRADNDTLRQSYDGNQFSGGVTLTQIDRSLDWCRLAFRCDLTLTPTD